MVKIWKLREGRRLSPLPRNLIVFGPLPFCGNPGRSLRVDERRGRTYGVGTYPGLHHRDRGRVASHVHSRYDGRQPASVRLRKPWDAAGVKMVDPAIG